MSYAFLQERGLSEGGCEVLEYQSYQEFYLLKV
jgi:hypothetical protein